jgi:hypothetical protein
LHSSEIRWIIEGGKRAMKNTKYAVSGEEYEIKCAATVRGIEIRAYLRSIQIGPVRIAPYEVIPQYDASPARLTESGAVATLIGCVKDDLSRMEVSKPTQRRLLLAKSSH